MRRKPSFTDTLGSVLRWTAGLPVFTLAAVFIIPVSFFLSPRRLHPLLRALCAFVVRLGGVQLRLHGLEKLDRAATYLFVFNHINLFDHFVIAAALPFVIRGVEKEDHFRWPVYGILLKRIGQIPIPPRGDTSRAIRALGEAKELLARGVSIGMAPEGTRSETGELQPFKKGAFHLAIDTEATLVPLVLVGAFQFNQKGDWRVYPCAIDVYVEDPIPTRGMTTKDIPALLERTRSVMTSRLLENARSPQSFDRSMV